MTRCKCECKRKNIPDLEISGYKESLIIEEYKSCRDAIIKNIEIMEKFEIYCVSAIAISLSFSISISISILKNNHNLYDISTITPFAISVFGLIKYMSLDNAIGIYNKYLRSTEDQISTIDLSTFFKKNNDNNFINLRFVHYVFWLFLIVGTLICSFLLWK